MGDTTFARYGGCRLLSFSLVLVTPQIRVAEGARFSVVFVAGHVPVAILPVKSMRMREKKA